jgi:hypothetical protein
VPAHFRGAAVAFGEALNLIYGESILLNKILSGFVNLKFAPF